MEQGNHLHTSEDRIQPYSVDIVSCLEMEGLLTPIGGSAGRREAFLVEEFDPRYDERWLGVVGGGLSESRPPASCRETVVSCRVSIGPTTPVGLGAGWAVRVAISKPLSPDCKGLDDRRGNG